MADTAKDFKGLFISCSVVGERRQQPTSSNIPARFSPRLHRPLGRPDFSDGCTCLLRAAHSQFCSLGDLTPAEVHGGHSASSWAADILELNMSATTDMYSIPILVSRAAFPISVTSRQTTPLSPSAPSLPKTHPFQKVLCSQHLPFQTCAVLPQRLRVSSGHHHFTT